MSEELTPMNHRELWLQAIATGTVPEWLEPMTHEELWLKTIAQGGGGGGVLVVHDVDDTLDKTWQEIFDADACILQAFKSDDMYSQRFVLEVKHKGGTYSVTTLEWNGEEIYESVYTTSSADGYPTNA